MVERADFRNRKARIYKYVSVVIAIVLCWSIPNKFYGMIQHHFVSVFSKISLPTRFFWDDSLSKDTLNMVLQEHLTLLEEHLLSTQVKEHSPPLFTKVLSPYFQNLVVSHVVYRDPSYWGSSCWVDVGKNQGIRKNSPVVVGKVLIGLVDYVGEKQSRVRLITDVGMKPSVIAVRGGIQNWIVKDQIQTLIDRLIILSQTSTLSDEHNKVLHHLQYLNDMLQCNEKNEFQLRGVLCGKGGALWKTQSSVLQGDHFCFVKGKGLIQGDLLVTTGLDGVFPPGLLVAEITKVFPPNEGACCFKIEATSLAKDNLSGSTFLILPPMEFNPNDRPDIFGLLWE